MIFEIEKALVSSDILDKSFSCNLKVCKGACCVEGDAGAPLEANELLYLDDVYSRVKPYMTQKGINAIASQGKYVRAAFGEWETPLVEGGECAYASFDSCGSVSCAIEKAYDEDRTSWIKPISCHLYPIRLKVYEKFIAVNYHHWDVCQSACSLGRQQRIALYKFLKIPLIRKFGKKWYEQLEIVARKFVESNNQ